MMRGPSGAIRNHDPSRIRRRSDASFLYSSAVSLSREQILQLLEILDRLIANVVSRMEVQKLQQGSSGSSGADSFRSATNLVAKVLSSVDSVEGRYFYIST